MNNNIKEDFLPFEKIKRQVILRRQAETSDKFGCKPSERTMQQLFDYGLINVDKPRGPTSHQVTSYVRDILGVAKAGHSGTLDPHVTGVLPVAFGRGTRIVEHLLTAGKEYVCLMHIHQEVPEELIRQKFIALTGKISQLPPVRSAVKRVVRERSVYYARIIEIHGQDVLFSIGCQAGTYIRKWVHDLGLSLKTGAHMVELRRTKAGPFKQDTLVTLQDITDAHWYYKNQGNEKFLRSIIQPFENAISHIPKVWVTDTTVDSLCHGAILGVPGISKLDSGIERQDKVAVMTLKDELVCMGTAKLSTKEMLGEKGYAVKTDKVFMEIGTYPKIEREKKDEVHPHG